MLFQCKPSNKSGELWESAPDGQKAAIEASGLDVSSAKHGWRVIQHEDGSRDSVFWKAEAAEATKSPEDILSQIADRMDKIRPAPAIKRPAQTGTHIRNFLPFFDVHMSMRVGDYGTAECVDRLKAGTSDLLERMPPAECTIILNGGDYTEANDPSFQTPKSQHPLSVDMEYDDTTDVAVEVTIWKIERALERSDHVIYKALRGNHDPNTARILRAALKQRYIENERVTIDTDGIDEFAHHWEGNFIAAHHGDLKKKPVDLILAFANRHADKWQPREFRELWVGHNHSYKFIGADETGMTFNQVRAITPPGRYTIENMWDSPSEMIGVTYRKGGGRLSTLTHGFWPEATA
jgi:hypothetical protein